MAKETPKNPLWKRHPYPFLNQALPRGRNGYTVLRPYLWQCLVYVFKQLCLLLIDIRTSICLSSTCFGAVAHLARAIEWHSIGSRFDPDQLHFQTALFQGAVFLCPNGHRIHPGHLERFRPYQTVPERLERTRTPRPCQTVQERHVGRRMNHAHRLKVFFYIHFRPKNYQTS